MGTKMLFKKLLVLTLGVTVVATGLTLDAIPKISSPESAHAASVSSNSCPSFIRTSVSGWNVLGSVPYYPVSGATFTASASASSSARDIRNVGVSGVPGAFRWSDSGNYTATSYTKSASSNRISVSYQQSRSQDNWVWSSWSRTGRFSPPITSRTTTNTTNVQTRWVVVGTTFSGGRVVTRYAEERRTRSNQPITVWDNKSCGFTANFDSKTIPVTQPNPIRSIRLSTNATFGADSYTINVNHNGGALFGSLRVTMLNPSGTEKTAYFNGSSSATVVFGTEDGLNFKVNNFLPSGGAGRSLAISEHEGRNIFSLPSTFTYDRTKWGTPRTNNIDDLSSGDRTQTLIINQKGLENSWNAGTTNFAIHGRVGRESAGSASMNINAEFAPVCRLNQSNLKIRTPQTISAPVKVSHQGITFYTAVLDVFGSSGNTLLIDWGATISANPWVRDTRYVSSATSFGTMKHAYQYVGGTVTKVSAAWKDGKTLRVVYQPFNSAYSSCYTDITGIAINSQNTFDARLASVTQVIDPTGVGSHPSGIHFLIAVGSTISRPEMVGAVKCYPEATTVTYGIYDQGQRPIPRASYQALDGPSQRALTRTNFLNTEATDPRFVFGGRPMTREPSPSTDIWYTALKPAPGGPIPPRPECIVPVMGSSQITFGEWSRTNFNLLGGQNPVFVDDTITLSGVSVSKVGDPGRVLDGTITVRLTHSGGQTITRTCDNFPSNCSNINFGKVPQAGTWRFSASWGGDPGVRGTTASGPSFTVNKYRTVLDWNGQVRNSVGERDFPERFPVSIRNNSTSSDSASIRLRVGPSSIASSPFLPLSEVGGATPQVNAALKVEFRSAPKNGGSWTGWSVVPNNKITPTRDCFRNSEICRLNIKFDAEARYQVRLTYEGDARKFEPAAAVTSEIFWVYEDFRCTNINAGTNGTSMLVQWFGNGVINNAAQGGVLRNGNPMIVTHPFIDTDGFKGVVRIDRWETRSHFKGTPLADGANVQVYSAPVLSGTQLTNFLRGDSSPSLTQYQLASGSPTVNGNYIFNNTQQWTGTTINLPNGGTKTVVRVFEVSDLNDPGLRMMQEIRLFGVYYWNGIRVQGNRACEDADAPRTGMFKFDKVTLTQ
jgi:hypothetical protein